MELSNYEMQSLSGKIYFSDTNNLLKYLLQVALFASVIKTILSAKGKITIFGITLQWGK